MSKRGRPRSFDRTAALERALQVFWARGYEGASLATLTRAMRINSPSLYAAFGSKEELFREALEHYGNTQGSPVLRALREGETARESIEAMLRASAEVIALSRTPRGCPIVLSAINYGVGNERVRDYGKRLRQAQRDEIRARLARAIEDGELPPQADLDRMVAFYSAALYGLAVHARDGAAPETLHAIVDGAMAAWDTLAGQRNPA